jgi:TonB family protein
LKKYATFWMATFVFVMQASTLTLPQLNPAAPQSSPPPLADVTVQVSPQEADARLDRKVEPEYPTKARDAGIQGDVVLNILIGKNGKVKNITVVSGDPVLAHAAVSAVKHWRYEPWASGGNNVETQTTATFHFVLAKGPMTCPGQEPGAYRFLADARPDISGGIATAQVPPVATVFKVGGSVKPPRTIYAPDPEYSESARRHKQQGTGVLRLIVTPEGKVALVKAERVIGFGLDQKAVNAVCQWKFKPALKDGQPVPVEIEVEVSFRLY